MNSLFASTARGLEELLKTELENPGAVECRGSGWGPFQGRHTACLPEPDVEAARPRVLCCRWASVRFTAI